MMPIFLFANLPHILQSFSRVSYVGLVYWMPRQFWLFSLEAVPLGRQPGLADLTLCPPSFPSGNTLCLLPTLGPIFKHLFLHFGQRKVSNQVR